VRPASTRIDPHIGRLLAGGILPAEQAAVDFVKRTGDGAINRSENLGNMVLDDWSVISGESYNYQPAPGKVLLIDKASIASDKNLKPVFFRGPQQFAVFQFTPSQVGSGDDLMIAERAKAGSKLVR
jgi:hypothetical protein